MLQSRATLLHSGGFFTEWGRFTLLQSGAGNEVQSEVIIKKMEQVLQSRATLSQWGGIKQWDNYYKEGQYNYQIDFNKEVF